MNNELNQLSIFDVFAELDKNEDTQISTYEINEQIQIRKVQESEEIDPEDYYYLKEFSEKKGKVVTKNIYSNGTCYVVSFENGRTGYFYSEDMIRI